MLGSFRASTLTDPRFITVFADAPLTAVTLTTSYADMCSNTVQISAGDTIEVEVFGTAFNNSGTTQTYRFQLVVGGVSLEVIDGATIASSATNRAPFVVRAVASVVSTSSNICTIFMWRPGPVAQNTSTSSNAASQRWAWNTSATDITGSRTVALQTRTGATGSNQTVYVHSFRISRIAERL